MTEDLPFRAGEARAISEAFADLVVERRLIVERTPALAARAVDVGEVACLVGHNSMSVCAHAAELPASRIDGSAGVELELRGSRLRLVDQEKLGV